MCAHPKIPILTVFVLTLTSVNIITRIHKNSPSLRRTAAAVAVRTAASVLKPSQSSMETAYVKYTYTSISVPSLQLSISIVNVAARSVYTRPRRLITRILMTQKSATQTHTGCTCYRIRERAIARRGEHTKTKTSIRSVSWMRKRDMHILSVGILMYTSDLRFQVIHPEKSDNWTLQIKSPQKRDSGIYECQVSTEPKMYLNYSLNVIVFSSTTMFKLKLMINFVGIGSKYLVQSLIFCFLIEEAL
uniref:Ig-like domain-containing protein n=1 Tax=Trichogramma kaykai TaxID=54128 RepID=A0ABD2WNL7_9HYME